MENQKFITRHLNGFRKYLRNEKNTVKPGSFNAEIPSAAWIFNRVVFKPPRALYFCMTAYLKLGIAGLLLFSGFYMANVQAADGYGIQSRLKDTSLDSNMVGAIHTAIAPIIDGIGNDSCWDSAQWHNIDHTWITWGEKIDSSDFFGRFKVTWSESENLLYYLVEITDDIFVDGYVYPNEGYPNFDIVEIFIDENKSGGLHVFDNSASWGENSENAFSYHIAVNAPEDERTESSFVVCDIDGTGWNDKTIADYASHFPELTMKKLGNQYIYEFSMAVYDDTYEHANPEESRVSLTADKLMGMTVAYCDNDAPGTERDNFFGSVWVPEEEYNDHWQNANGYGGLRLFASETNINHPVQAINNIKDYQIAELDTSYKVLDDVTTLFSDPDHDALVYTLDFDDSVLHAFIADSGLYVKASSAFTGSKTITVTASDHESKASHEFDVRMKTTAIKSNNFSQRNIQCYPNPFASTITVKLLNIQEWSEFINLSIYNLSGKLVFSKNHQNTPGSKNLIRLKASIIPPGVYILKVRDQKGNNEVIRIDNMQAL